MKYRDYKVGFTFEVMDHFSEVRESSFEVFDVADNTLKYFILLDDEGEIERSLSITKDSAEIKSDEDYATAIDRNVALMEEMGYVKLMNNQLQTEKGYIIDRYVFGDPEIEETIGLLVYFMRLKNSLLISSCYIGELYDDFENEMFFMYNTIEEL